MVKAAKSYQQKYEKIMGESSEDELWSDIERDIAEFKKKVEFGKADGYFWNMYFNLLRSNRLMFAGINKAFITGDMAYRLNGIYQENRFNCIYGNRANSGGAQTINFIEVVLAYSCNDYKLLERIMPFEAGPASSGYSAPYYNMVYAMTYHDDEVGKKAQAELSTFMEKKRTQFDLKLAKFFYDLYQKDVDGITDLSMAGVFMGKDMGYAPCTPSACMEVLEHYGIDCTGKKVVVIGRSLVVGKPAAMMLLKKNATVTVCHTRTVDMPSVVKEADIVVVAAGKAGVIDGNYLREGQIVIDVGINVNEEGKLCGDVNFEEAEKIVDAITPVPRGVGGVTTSILLEHVVDAAIAQNR